MIDCFVNTIFYFIMMCVIRRTRVTRFRSQSGVVSAESQMTTEHDGFEVYNFISSHKISSSVAYE